MTTDAESVIEHIDTVIPYLKPCRCCGIDNPRMLFGKKIGTDLDVFRVMCDACGNNSEIYDNELELVESWNKRKFELSDESVSV